MPAYIVVQVQVHDPVAYEEYKKNVPATLALHDGKFVVRGGNTHSQMILVDGYEPLAPLDLSKSG